MAMFIYACLFVALLAWGCFVLWRWKDTREFASEVLALRKQSAEIPEDVTAAEFTPLYMASEGPRAQTYLFLSALFVTVMLPVFASLFNLVWGVFWAGAGRPPVFEVGTLVHTFCMFLGIVGLIVGVLALSMRRYYSKMPRDFKHVLRDLNEGMS
ncbi:MAG: hypothetical protein ACRBEQ_13460 [Hyphomonas sp.]